MTRLVNPKDIEAQKVDKAPLDLLEPAGDEAGARALAFGAGKYGIRNYIESPIAARVYVAAMRRHLTAWLKGEDYAEDSGVHHLGHVIANCHIALAAIEAGTFIDDRHGREDVADNLREADEETRREATREDVERWESGVELPDPHHWHVGHSISEPCVPQCPFFIPYGAAAAS